MSDINSGRMFISDLDTCCNLRLLACLKISGSFVTKPKLQKLLTVNYTFSVFASSLDPAMSFKGLSGALVPELAGDQQLVTVSSCTLKDCDLDTESTVL